MRHTASWQRITLLTDKAVQLSTASPCVLQDGSIPRVHRRMENKIEWFAGTPQNRDLDRVDGEPIDISWRLSPEDSDEAELAKMDGSCRGYTLPRDDQLSKSKRMDWWSTKIGPVLQVTVSDHQSRYRIEIRINSLFGDGSHSCIMIENGLNKHVTEMSEEIQKNRNDEIGASAVRLAAKARPKQTSMPRSSSPRVTIPFHMLKSIDVEPGEYDWHSFRVSMKMIRLLRHDSSILRKEDGAVELKILASMFALDALSSMLEVSVRPSCPPGFSTTFRGDGGDSYILLYITSPELIATTFSIHAAGRALWRMIALDLVW